MAKTLLDLDIQSKLASCTNQILASNAVTNVKVDAGAAIAFSKLASLSTGYILAGNAGVPTAVQLSSDATIAANGALTIANSAITNVKVSATAAIDYTKLAATTPGYIMVGRVTDGYLAGVAMSGDITISNSGVTAIGSLKVTDGMLAGSITTSKLSDASKFLLNDANRSIGNAVRYSYAQSQTFSSAFDLVTKEYVDSVASGLDVKQSVARIGLVTDGSSGNITLSGVAQPLDGAVPTAEDRVLLRYQTTASQNGIWVVKAGAWVRPTDFPVGGNAAGAFTFVEGGSTQADTGWVCTSDSGAAVIDTNSLAFTQFSGAGSYTAGSGISISGTTISAKYDNGTIGIDGSSQLYVKNSSITATQLNTTGVSANSYGGAASVATFTVAADGRLTAAGSTSIAIAQSAVTNLTTDLGNKVDKTTFDTQGDLLVGTGADAYGKFVVGTTNGYALLVDSTNGTYGMNWGKVVTGLQVTRETPNEVPDDVRTAFTVDNNFTAGTEMVFLNGMLQDDGASNDYTVTSANTVTFTSAPPTGAKIRISYRY